MAGSKLKGQALWSVVLNLSRLGGNAIIFLAMARFLTIEQIGAFGMAYAPVRLMQVIHKAGVSDSVVILQRKSAGLQHDSLEKALSALFWLAISSTAAIVVIITGIASLLMVFQQTEQPVGLMMLVLLAVPVAFGLSSVPEGLLRKNLQIKALALRTLAVQVLSAGFAVLLAVWGYGGWALVGFAVLNAVLTSLISIAMARWHPVGGPNLKAMPAQLPQMSLISGRALVSGSVYAMLQFSIGLVLGLEAAGAFQIAQRVYQILDALCLAPIRFLVLPLFSRAAEEGDGVLPSETVERALTTAGLISAPFYLGTIAVAGPVLTLIIGAENAGYSVASLQLLCLLGLSITTVTILSQAVTVAGHAKLAFWRAAWTLIMTAALSLPALLISVEAVTLGFVVASYLVLAVFFRQIEPILSVRGMSAFLAVARPYFAGVLALAPLWALETYLVSRLGVSIWWVLLGFVPLGTGLYIGAARLIDPVGFKMLRSTLKS